MELAMVGLGRMGGNMARRLLRGGHRVVVWNRTYEKAEELGAEGAEPVRELADVVAALAAPRAIWLMLPYGDPTQEVIDALVPLLDEGDILIDGGNSPFQLDIERGAALAERGLRYLDAGTSGGVWGLEVGYCLMVGGERSAFEHIEPVLQTLAPPGHGYEYCGGHGSGHFVKMVHNGIEYGMMQAYAEGFELLNATAWDLDLASIADLWNQGSVVRSWLLELAADALQEGPRSGEHHGLRGGHRGGPLDGRAGHPAQRADAGHHGRPVHALPLAAGRHVLRQGARRAAQRVRRPRRAGEGVNDRPDLPRYRDDAPEPHIGYESADRYGDDECLPVGGLPHLGEVPSPFGGRRDPDPCSLVIFGVTGDLTHRKLIPALYDLGCHGVLPADTTLVGYGRQELGDDPLRARMREAIDDHYGQEIVDGALCERILREPRYVHGELDEPEGYARLAAALDELDKQGSRGNRMFYLATPPSQFEPIIRGLGAAGLARRGAFDAAHGQGEPPGWTRIVIEKPFGRDLAIARGI